MTKMKVIYKGNLHTECMHESGARIETDAPKDNEGKGECFSPTDLVAIALASCMVTYMGILAKKMGIDLMGLTADVEKEMTSTPKRRIGKMVGRFRCPNNPGADARAKLEQAALHCAVHSSLHPEIKYEFDFVWGI